MAEIANRFCTKETLGLFGEQPVLAQTLEHRLDMLQMLGPCRTIDQYIIKKYKDEPMEERLEDVVHKSLECCGRIRQAKGHHQELIVAPMSSERRLRDIIRMHPDLVVAAAEIDLGEVAGALELVEELVNDRNWKFILHGLVIEGPIVDAESPRPITLLL